MTIVLLTKSCSSYWKKTATSTEKRLWNRNHLSTFCGRYLERETAKLSCLIWSLKFIQRFSVFLSSSFRRKVNPCIQSSTIKSTNYLFLSRFLEISLAFFREVTIKITSFRYQLFIFLVEVRKKKSFFYSTWRKRNRDTINIIFYVIFQSESVKSRLLYYSDASEKSFEDKLSIETRQIAQSE